MPLFAVDSEDDHLRGTVDGKRRTAYLPKFTLQLEVYEEMVVRRNGKGSEHVPEGMRTGICRTASAVYSDQRSELIRAARVIMFLIPTFEIVFV